MDATVGSLHKVSFGLSGGLGNCCFALPAVKALSRTREVHLCITGDFPDMRELFARCRYATGIIEPRPKSPSGFDLLAGQYAPTKDPRWKKLGWPPNTMRYPHPEWAQVKFGAVGDMEPEDVTDWIVTEPPSDQWDVALIPGCKPHTWLRKRWPGMLELAEALIARGLRVVAFGQRDEIEDAGLASWWTGPLPLSRVADELRGARVVVGTDSGVTHLASSLGVPTVMLFTATSAIKGQPVGPADRVWTVSLGLECSPCQSLPRWGECQDWRCREISVADVLRLTEDALDRREHAAGDAAMEPRL